MNGMKCKKDCIQLQIIIHETCYYKCNILCFYYPHDATMLLLVCYMLWPHICPSTMAEWTELAFLHRNNPLLILHYVIREFGYIQN